MFKDWDYKIAERHDPLVRWGLFGLAGGGAGNTGGQANDGGAGAGGMNDATGSRGGSNNAGGEGGGSDGSNTSPYPTNTGNGTASGSDPLGDIFAGLAAAQVEAANIMAEATRQAAEQIRAGQEAAAKATIESAKIASAAVLEQANIADERIREFWDAARADLKPIIDQGRFASDEMAAMMGIADSQGNITPWDGSDLAETPGYQWAFDQGNRALQNSAVGTALSGANTRATIEYGQGMANQQFNTRLEQLGFLAQGGWGAARDQANAATQTGNTFANVHMQAGSDLANIQNTKGSNLSNIYTSGGNNMANITMQGAQSRAGLITGLATAGANLQMAQMNNQATMAAASQSASASRSNSMMGAIGTIGGALLGGPLGGFLGGLFS